MIISWMLYGIIVGSLASTAALMLDRGARANRLPGRFVWVAALVATVLAPFVGYTATRMLDGTADGSVIVGSMNGSAISTVEESPSAAARLIAVLSDVASRVDRPVAVAWAALSLLLLTRLASATVILWRRRREWIAREIDGVHLFVTPDLGPAVVALPESRILVPEWLLRLEPAQISAVLHHEREHAAAGDPRLLVVASVFTALFPWNPTLWWQSRRLRLAVEMDCDARVLRRDPRVDRYGSLLLAIAQHPRAPLHAAATLTESSSDLERRIHAMTSRPPSAPRLVGAVCAVIAVAAIFVACAVPAPDVVAGPTRVEPVATGPTPVSADQAFMDFQVESPAKPMPGSMPPKYPLQLRTAGVGGVVVARFVVDTNGLTRMPTLEILKSDHDLFTNAVRSSLGEFRFSPAEVGGRKVKQVVQMPFIFSLSTEERDSLRKSAAMKRAGETSSDVKPQPPVATRARELVTVAAAPPASPRLIEVPATKTPDSLAGRAGDGALNRAIEKARAVVEKLGDTIPASLPGGIGGYPFPPAYPSQLRAANIEGQVVATFAVLTSGRVDMSTFVIQKSDHDLFANSVREWARGVEFLPARINGVKVDWRVRMPFVFSLSK
jgi:TonB family protein